MKSLVSKSNEYVFFLLGLILPFVNTWKIAGHSLFNIQQIAFLLIVYYALSYKSFSKYNRAVNRISSKLSLYFGIYTFLTFVSFLFIEENLELGFQQTLNNIQLFIVYFLLTILTFSEGSISALFKGLFYSFLISVLIAFMQFKGNTAFNILGENQIADNASYGSVEKGTDIIRVWGTFGNPLTFSLYLSVVGITLFYYFGYLKKKRLLAAVILVLAFVSISFTVSRMAIVALIGSVAFIQVLLASKAGKLAYILGFIVFIVALNVFISGLSESIPLVDRFLNSQEDFKEGRFDLWLVGYKVWSKNLFWGAGPGNLSIQLYNNGWTHFLDSRAIKTAIGHVENYYLTILYTFGTIPFVFFTLFNYQYFSYLSAVYKRSKDVLFRPLSICLLGGLFCFFINNFINPILISDQRIQVLFVLLLVLTNVIYKRLIVDGWIASHKEKISDH